MNKTSLALEGAISQLRQIHVELDGMLRRRRESGDLQSIGLKLIALRNKLPAEVQKEIHELAQLTRSEIDSLEGPTKTEETAVLRALLNADLMTLRALCEHVGSSPCRYCGATFESFI